MAPKRSGIFKNAKDKTKALGKAMKTMKVMKGTTVKAKAKSWERPQPRMRLLPESPQELGKVGGTYFGRQSETGYRSLR